MLKLVNENFVFLFVDVINYVGLRFDCDGNFILYSIFGSLLEFKRVVKECGEFNEFFVVENVKMVILMKKEGE